MSDDMQELKEESAPLRPMTELEGMTSSIFHISLRGWLALILVVTVCYMAIMQIEVKEPLYTLATMALGFYFGQKVAAK